MGNSLKAIAKTMCEVVRRIDLPLATRSKMPHWLLFRVQDPVCGDIPHLRIPVSEILLHA